MLACGTAHRRAVFTRVFTARYLVHAGRPSSTPTVARSRTRASCSRLPRVVRRESRSGDRASAACQFAAKFERAWKEEGTSEKSASSVCVPCHHRPRYRRPRCRPRSPVRRLSIGPPMRPRGGDPHARARARARRVCERRACLRA